MLRLVPALCEVAQDLADILAKGEKLGGEGTTLTERLASRGTYSGVAGEAVAYGVQAPEAIAAQLLLADGDAERRNRKFLLNTDLRVAGVGLAAHPQHGTVVVLTLVTLFAVPIAEPMKVECQGEANKEFQRVLDAIPSEQARNIATDALVTGKKVGIAYEPGKVLITVHERDGSQHNSSLKWA